MTATPRGPESHTGEAGWLTLAAALLLALVKPALLPAQERPNPGLVVPIPTTITTQATRSLRSAVYGPLRHFEDERSRDPKNAGTFYLVCDFNPDQHENHSDDFGACLTLATALRDLQKKQGVHVLAYVHGKITRHAVLPVLACSEIILSSDPPASLGKVTEPDRPLERLERLAYSEIPNPRFPSVFVRKMYDKDVAIVKARDGSYRDANEKPRPQGEAVSGLGEGDTALYSFTQARDFGLCQPIPRNSIDEVRDRYHLSPASLYPTLDHVVARRITVTGPITGELRDKVERRVKKALAQKANLLIFELACFDGDSQTANDLGVFLAGINDSRREPVETIAYITGRARNTAAFIAFACNKIVMQRGVKKQEGVEAVVQPPARLGDFERYIEEHPTLETTIRRNLAELAGRKHYPPIIAEGLVDRDLRIVAVESTREESARKFISEAELKADQQGPRHWRTVAVIKPANDREQGKYLTLTADQARDLGIARDTVANLDEVCELEGVSPADVPPEESDWLDGLVDFLKDPWTSVVLVMLGITCLILELKMPGVGLPGVISAVCFLLFFWSHSQISGQVVWLAFLLFLLGLLLIGLEVFVLPGFGVAGISGILLVLGSLGLVAYGHWPRSNEEWIGFGQAIGPFGISIMGALVCAFFLARYLPNIPYVNRLMLRPADEAGENGEEVQDSIHPELTALLGAIGVTATPLRPAGKVQFGDDFVDVVAEGSYVMPGTRVQVVEIEGNRIVVKEV
jgi:membrane-bound serine protease (ClpP class)